LDKDTAGLELDNQLHLDAMVVNFPLSTELQVEK